MSIVLHWKPRAWRPGWAETLAMRVFALRAQMRDENAKGRDQGTPGGQPSATTSNATGLTGSMAPSGGEDAAFDAFFTQHEHALYGYLRRMLPTHDAALDVAQEAFFRAWQRFDTISAYDRPQAWLFRVATNLALDILRSRQRIGLPRLLNERDTRPPDDKATDETEALAVQMDPFDMERALADRDLMNQALARLPERQRAAVLLWAAHGLTCGEIADALGTTEVNVRQLLSRGRARFREFYEQGQS